MIDVFWIGQEPVKYEVRRTVRSDLRERGVLIVRCEDSEENCQQAALEMVQDGDTIRLAQFDGDLDAKREIERDQRAMRYAERPFNIWQRIWRTALIGEVA